MTDTSSEYVIPNGNEQDFIAKALELGIKKLVFLYKDKKLPDALTVEGLSLSVGRIGSPATQNEPAVALGTTIEKLDSTYSFLSEIEYDSKRDGLHQRRSGGSEALFAEAKKKGLGYMISYAKLQAADKPVQIMGRIRQNALLAAKKEVPVVLCSMATSPDQLRSPSDVAALARILAK